MHTRRSRDQDNLDDEDTRARQRKCNRLPGLSASVSNREAAERRSYAMSATTPAQTHKPDCTLADGTCGCGNTAHWHQRLVRCVEEALAKLPYVKWDRWTGELGSEDGIAVYGWIARDDSKADFVWMRIDNDGPWMFATSSAQYSADISKRLNFQGSSGHHPCKRVEDFFNVTTCRKPKAPNGQALRPGRTQTKP